MGWAAWRGTGGRARLEPWSGAWAHTLLGRSVAVLVVFHIVCLGWILFRADSFDTVLVYLGAFAQPQTADMQATPFTVGLLVLGLALHAVPRDLPARLADCASMVPAWAWGVTAGVVVAAIDAIGPEGVAPFIYFQF